MKRIWLALALVLSACTPKTAEQVGDRFVDLYFVEIDQKRALELATGLARTKLEEELSLVEKIRATYEPEAAKPSVFYTRKSANVGAEHANLIYEITVRQGRDENKRLAFISLEKNGDKWTVGNFMVREPPPPSTHPPEGP
jgi:hypothetical protein